MPRHTRRGARSRPALARAAVTRLLRAAVACDVPARRLRAALASAAVALLASASPAHAANLYVANFTAGTVSQFAVAADGSLTPMSPASLAAGAGPQGIAVSPDGRSVYVANNTAPGSISQYSVAADGSLAPKVPPTVAASRPTGVTVSPDGHSAYAGIGLNPAAVSQFDVAADGTLTPKTPATVASGGTNTPGAVVINAAGTRAYVGNNAGSVSQLAIAADGTLSPLSPLNVLSGGSQSPAIALSPTGATLYAANRGANTVSRFAVSAPDGLLTLGASAAAGGQPNGVTVSPDGHSVYVANQRASDGQFISQYDAAPDGSLTPKTPPTVPSVTTPKMLAMSTDGHSAYVPNQGSGDVTQFAVAANGTLTPLSPATVVAGAGAFAAVYSSGPIASATPPSVQTGAAGAIGDGGASLAGTVNPNGAATSYTFEYGTSLSFGTITTVTSAGSGTTSSPVAATLTGLAPSTTYYFRLVAVNAGGPTFGVVQRFRTTPASAPSVVTQAPTATATTSATLHALVNPSGQTTTYTFEYGTSLSFGAITPVVALDDADAPEPVSASLTGLAPDTTYYVRAVATNATGTTLGAVVAFATGPGGLPVVTTGDATGLTPTAAVLSATVDPHGAATAFAFEYGPSESFGALSAVDNAGSGNGAQTVMLPISGLAPGTTYRYRIVATNSGGTAAGAVQTFTTPTT